MGRKTEEMFVFSSANLGFIKVDLSRLKHSTLCNLGEKLAHMKHLQRKHIEQLAEAFSLSFEQTPSFWRPAMGPNAWPSLRARLCARLRASAAVRLSAPALSERFGQESQEWRGGSGEALWDVQICQNQWV